MAAALPRPRFSTLVLIGLGLILTSGSPLRSSSLSRVLLEEAAEISGARCLDGSPAAYYWRPGYGSGAQSWILFFEGGGWCAGFADAVGGFDSCLSRSKGGLGSSTGTAPTMELGYQGGATLSPDPTVNPRFYNWNVAYAHYCDGASFSGNRSEAVDVNGTQLYFRGARIFEAIVSNITAPVSQGGKGMAGAQQAILSGCSAGGLAVYLHCDAFAGMLPQTAVKCVADAGYFANIPSMFGQPPVPNPRNSIIEYEYTWVFTQQQSNNSLIGVNQRCLAAIGRWNPLCFFPEYNLKYTTTPLFVLNSGYDSWQTNFIWFTPDGGKPTFDSQWMKCAQYIKTCNETQLQLMGKFHSQFVAKLAPMTDPATPHGGFVESCMSHCQSGGVVPSGAYDNRTSLQAIADWYDGKFLAKAIDAPYPKGDSSCP